MSAKGRGPRRRSGSGKDPAQEVLAAVAERMVAKLPEIEEAASAQVHALSDAEMNLEAEYIVGLRSAVPTGIRHGFELMTCDPDRPPPVPAALLIQARLAARNGIPLVTVQDRYFAGYDVLNHFLTEEIGHDPAEAAVLKRLVRHHVPLFKRLLAAITEEYMREAQTPPFSTERSKLKRIERLRDGEFVDISDLGYELDVWHLGVVGSGAGAAEAIRQVGKSIDAASLTVSPAEETVWAWFGARRRLDPGRIESAILAASPSDVLVAVGEPGQRRAGWRLTHRQAAAALRIALLRGDSFARYKAVALEASISQDDLFATSLRELYLAPIMAERNGGVLLETLRAYLVAGGNTSAASKALTVNRRTVSKRLERIADALESPLAPIAVEVELALRLCDLEGA